MCVRTQSILLALGPAALVDSAIGPLMNAIALLDVLVKFSLENPAVLPLVNSDALHQAIIPLTNKSTPVSPLVSAKALQFIVNPLACVFRALFPLKDPDSFLLTVLIISKIRIAVSPGLLTQAMLLAAAPVALVDCPVFVFKLTEAVHLVHGPFALVDVSVRVLKLAFVGRLSELPLANVHSSVFPGHGSEPVTEAPKPFACINGASLVCELLLHYRHSIQLEWPAHSNGLLGLILPEVLHLRLISPLLSQKHLHKPLGLYLFKSRLNLDYCAAVRVNEFLVVNLFILQRLSQHGFHLFGGKPEGLVKVSDCKVQIIFGEALFVGQFSNIHVVLISRVARSAASGTHLIYILFELLK